MATKKPGFLKRRTLRKAEAEKEAKFFEELTDEEKKEFLAEKKKIGRRNKLKKTAKFAKKSTNLLLGATGILLGTKLPFGFDTKSDEYEKISAGDYGSNKGNDIDSNGGNSGGNNTSGLSDEIVSNLNEISKALKDTLDVSIISPDILQTNGLDGKDLNGIIGELVSTNSQLLEGFMSGIVESLSAGGMGDLSPDDIKELMEGVKEGIAEELKNNTENWLGGAGALFSGNDKNNESLGEQVGDSTSLDNAENEKEAQFIEDARHKELIDTLKSCCAVGGETGKSSAQDGDKGGGSGWLETLITAWIGLKAGGGLINLATRLATFSGKLVNFGKVAGKVVGKFALVAATLYQVAEGLIDLWNGEEQLEMPKGWDMINPMKWAMYVGHKINELYAGISKFFGGSGSLGSDIYDAVEGIRKQYEEVQQYVKDNYEGWKDTISTAFSDSLQFTKDTFTSGVEWGTDLYESISTYFSNLTMEDVVNGIKEQYNKVAEAVGSKITEWSGSISATFSEGLTSGKELLSSIMATGGEIFQSITDFFSSISFSDIVDGIKEQYHAIVDGIGEKLSGWKDSISGLFSTDTAKDLSESAKALADFNDDTEKALEINAKESQDALAELKGHINDLDVRSSKRKELQAEYDKKALELERQEKALKDLKDINVAIKGVTDQNELNDLQEKKDKLITDIKGTQKGIAPTIEIEPSVLLPMQQGQKFDLTTPNVPYAYFDTPAIRQQQESVQLYPHNPIADPNSLTHEIIVESMKDVSAKVENQAATFLGGVKTTGQINSQQTNNSSNNSSVTIAPTTTINNSGSAFPTSIQRGVSMND